MLPTYYFSFRFAKRFSQTGLEKNMVPPAGFEPTTHSLENCCSIRLSYGGL